MQSKWSVVPVPSSPGTFFYTYIALSRSLFLFLTQDSTASPHLPDKLLSTLLTR